MVWHYARNIDRTSTNNEGGPYQREEEVVDDKIIIRSAASKFKIEKSLLYNRIKSN